MGFVVKGDGMREECEVGELKVMEGKKKLVEKGKVEIIKGKGKGVINDVGVEDEGRRWVWYSMD
ncbi:hypothetical protein [Bacillus subtilis]|uniref:hypothetical protein n=1 Tax=Bacillus subtilis TaxID=1423 RepID=UPI0011A0DDDD|nr:hypothetical protein [Bacillus subtilis]